MASWKRTVVVSLCVGIGAAVTLSAIIASWLWYQSQPRPWDKRAIEATFDYIDTEGAENNLAFHYVLENTTSTDYELSEGSAAVIMARLKRQESLSRNDDFVIVDYPIFIPVGQRLSFTIQLKYPYTYAKRLKRNATADERKEFREELATYIETEITNLDGFVLFDRTHRYQIIFPKGW